MRVRHRLRVRAALYPEALVVAEMKVQPVQLEVGESPDLTRDPLRGEVLAAVVAHQPAVRVARPVARVADGEHAAAALYELEQRPCSPEDAGLRTRGDADAVAADRERVGLGPPEAAIEDEVDLAATRRGAVQVGGQRAGHPGEPLTGRDARVHRKREGTVAALPLAHGGDREGAGIRRLGAARHRDARDERGGAGGTHYNAPRVTDSGCSGSPGASSPARGCRTTGLRAAAPSSRRRTGVVYGACCATDGSSAASARISRTMAAKRSSVSFVSVSVGSIMSASSTSSGK